MSKEPCQAAALSRSPSSGPGCDVEMGFAVLALSCSQGPKYVIDEDYTVSYLSAGRDLLRPTWDRQMVWELVSPTGSGTKISMKAEASNRPFGGFLAAALFAVSSRAVCLAKLDGFHQLCPGERRSQCAQLAFLPIRTSWRQRQKQKALAR